MTTPGDVCVERTALDRLFDPRSIVVIGASTDPGKRGYQVIQALRRSDYPYPVYGVNPRGTTVLDIPVLRSIAELPPGIDVALIALPAAAAPQAVRELAGVGVAAAVVLANGFRESGPSGATAESELAAAAAETGVRVVGPNTSGILNVATGANLVGVGDVPSGPVSALTQSGNMLLSLLADIRAAQGPGLHTYVGLGNQVDLRYDECLRHLATLPGTSAIAVHSEGLPDGRAFLVAAAEAARRRPVVLLRGGRSEAGKRSALSHTGSVAGADDVAAAVLTQAGVELVDRSDELAVVAGVLATANAIPAGRAVAVLSDGGGHAALAADALTAAGVPLAVLADETRNCLRALLGAPAAVANPVDVAGATDADPALFADAAAALFADPAVGSVLVVGLFGGYHLRFDARLAEDEMVAASRLVDLVDRTGLPVVVQSCYAIDQPENHRTLRDGGIPVLNSIDHAVRGVAALHRRGIRRADAHLRADLRLPSGRVDAGTSGDARLLDEPAARARLDGAGIDTGPWRFADSAAEAAAAVAEFAVPCAVKVVSSAVGHKSDVGGVRLGVAAADAGQAWESIMASVAAKAAGAEPAGVLVVPMAPTGVELLVGVTMDPIFGPVVAFGCGGVLVEALRDVAFRAAPFTRHEALEMIAETTASRMLDGYRGLPAVDRGTLAEFLVRVSEFAAAAVDLVELDLNPVIAAGDALYPVDVRIATR
ncbi:MAG: hypothetical protein HOQ24_04535 [Mycobacteriaceae bacterium]|nr:hypothetical protein [Mycobacteriaceae bacterium]